jgi:hypothetical protein
VSPVDRRYRYVYKPLLFVACLAPLGWAVAGVIAVAGIVHLPVPGLGADPVRRVLGIFGKTTLNLLGITLSVTPLRVLSGNANLLRLRRMLGVYAFAYALLHFLVYIGPFQGCSWAAIVKDLTKRPYIMVGFSAADADGARRHLDQRHDAAAQAPLAAVAPPRLRRGGLRRVALLVAGEEGHPRAAAVRRDARAAARLAPVAAARCVKVPPSHGPGRYRSLRAFAGQAAVALSCVSIPTASSGLPCTAEASLEAAGRIVDHDVDIHTPPRRLVQAVGALGVDDVRGLRPTDLELRLGT